jgi:ABC-type long-subunit fatty acid transport system fused permease/ATPase subunit
MIDSLNYFCIIVIAYLYIDSWVTAFRFKKIYKRLEELEKHKNAMF